MRPLLLAALLAAPAAAAPAAKPALETAVLEALRDERSPAPAPVKAVPVKDVLLAKAARVCRLTGMSNDRCLYKCSDGGDYSRPIDVEEPRPGDPFGSPRIACPQLVVPF